MVGGKPFNTKHKLNEYKHIKSIKQKKHGLDPKQNEAAFKEVDELTKAGVLQEVKYQMWVANQVMSKKSNRGWRMCVDFTDINKACPKECYPLPDINWEVESLLGPFLGHLITKQGIKPNPSKVKAITDLKPPCMLKEIQSLNEKLVALSQFLLKDADRSLPFFKALKSGTDMKTIHISDVLLSEKEKRHVPIYFISRVLQGAELNYPELERLILSLNYDARRLGRIAKWAIELGEHDIEFKGHNSIKGQTLADFLEKIPPVEDKGIEVKKPKTANKAPNSRST
ncbi:hypothetical protein Tco_1463713 [Tanacetum coccineum]